MKNIITGKIIIPLITLLFLTSPISAAPVLEIRNFNEKNLFTDLPVALFHKGDDFSFKESSFDDSAWQTVSLPSSWDSSIEGYDGIAWYRLRVKFPAQAHKRAVGIELGVIVDADEVYFNPKTSVYRLIYPVLS